MDAIASKEQQFRRGFTLIEMLVVLAVLCILAAISWPVLAGARENARATACLSNLGQISQALTMYVNDNDATYPPTFSQQSLWIQELQPYTTSGTKGGALLACPASQEPGLYDPAAETFPLVGYAYNTCLNTFTEAVFTPEGKNERLLTSSALTVTVFDARAGIYGLSRPDTGSLAGNGPAFFLGNPPGIIDQIAALPEGGRRHRGGANYSFADGHAHWFRPEQVQPAATCSVRGDGSRPGFGL